jgi:predicted PurR-regulated permease PerM
VVSQIQRLVDEWPTLWAKFQHSDLFSWLESHFHVQKAIKEVNAGALVSSATSPVLVAVGTTVSAVAAVITVAMLTLLMLIFGRDLVRASFAEVTPQRRARYARVTTNIYRSIGGYLGGIIVICAINAVCATTFLGLTHEPYFVVLGVLSGCSSMIPYAGPFVASTMISGVAWAAGGVSKALLTAGYFVLYGQIEGNVIAPIVFRRTAHVNPLITVLAILFLAELAGIFGAIIAVPVAAAGQIIVREVFAVRRERADADRVVVESSEELPEEPPPPH